MQQNTWSVTNTDRKWLSITGWHLLFWTLYTVFNFFLARLQDLSRNLFFIEYIAKYSLAALVFYANILIILPRFFHRRHMTLVVVSELALFGTIVGLQRIIYWYILPLGGYPKVTVFDIWKICAIMSWWWFQYTLFGFGYWYARQAIEKEKSIRQMERKQLEEARQKAELEKEKLLAEQAYLRAQINPHFLYNVLNFLYYKALTASDELAEGILTLSDIMRYAFKDENGSGKISLEDEVEHLKNLIKINQFRFDGKMHVDFRTTGDFRKARVIPFVFVTMLENTFKHGDLLNDMYPAAISLDYDAEARDIRFSIKNRKTQKKAEFSSGIGLQNMKRRLEQWYPGAYNLDIVETADNYCASLNIRL